MKNDLVAARAELARLIEQSPESSAPRIPADFDRPRRRTAEARRPEPAACAAGRCAAPKYPARATRALESAGACGRTRARAKCPAAFRTRHLAAGFEAAYLWRANQRAAARIHDRAGCADQLGSDHQHHPAREELQRENRRSQ